MTNLSTALRIGTSGIQTSQVGLGTISHNIVNANTVGYSRQIVQTGASSVNGFGNGVGLSSIQRISDHFVVARQRNAVSDAAYDSTRKSFLDSLESTFSNTGFGGGLESVVGGFITSFSQLANDPGNSALKRNVIQQAQLTTDTIQGIDAKLAQVATDADNNITAEIENINQVLSQIHQLNREITAQSFTANGSNANDLRDQRDQKISELAKNFKIQVAENSSTGAVRISIENGRKLIDESGYTQLTRVAGSGTYQDIGIQNVLVDGSLSGTIFPVTPSSLTSGKIKALIDIRDTSVTNLQSQLDEFTSTFKETVNQISSRGSSYPPQRTLTSDNTTSLATIATDLYASAGFTSLAGSTFNISVVNSLGDPVQTTVGSAAITLPGAGPFSLNTLATLINNNANVGNLVLGGSLGVTATATTNSSGQPILQIQAANSSYKVVLSNASGDVLGILGMNNIFSGTDASDIAVKTSLANDPNLLPIARMRSTDGGISTLDNQNILALSQLADTAISFSAAGGLGTQSTTATGYVNQIISNLAVDVADAKDRETFSTGIQSQLEEIASSVSGVNINEELSQMLVFQNSFQASARIVTVIDKLLEELVNVIG